MKIDVIATLYNDKGQVVKTVTSKNSDSAILSDFVNNVQNLYPDVIRITYDVTLTIK